ncbi:MAG: septum formation initiator family protein [Anaerolineaceae bacterium]
MEKKLPKIEKRQILLVGVLVIVGFLMMDMNSRLSELFRLKSQLEVAQTQYDYSVNENARLKDKIAYAQSDKAVDEWAREQGHMAKPGDVVVIPIPPEGTQIIPTPTPAPTVVEATNWEIWKELFFGE